MEKLTEHPAENSMQISGAIRIEIAPSPQRASSNFNRYPFQEQLWKEGISRWREGLLNEVLNRYNFLSAI